MSYFNLHPYYQQLQQQQQQRRPAAATAAHPYPFTSGHAGFPFATAAPTPASGPQYNFYTSSPQPELHHQYNDRSLEDEERAAIAHLQSIQRRKEVERVVREEAERERIAAQVRAHVQAQRERERDQELAAIRAQREREYERQQAAAAAAAEYERKVAIARRVQQHRRQQAITALAAAERQREQAVAAKHAIAERRQQCARHCAARRAEQVQQQTRPEPQAGQRVDGLDEFSRFLANVFGVALDEEQQVDNKKESEPTAPAPAPAPAPIPAKDEKPVATSVADPAEPVLPTPESKPATTTSTATESETDKKPEFPEAINDLLANFLGLRVEPDSKLGQAVSDKVPQGLNELLGQFGLEFVPDAPAKSAEPEAGPSEQQSKKVESASAPAGQSSSSSQPRHPFDLSEFLSGPNSLPPFVRDILGNVEQAFKNEQQGKKDEVKKEEVKVEGKGKGVAEGEKKQQQQPTSAHNTAPSATAAAPTPVPEPVVDEKKVSSDSLAKLDSIASEVKLATDSFTFPSALAFAPSTPTTAESSAPAPSLLFNKQNKPYHAQNNKLLQLLLQADGVASNGDREVRRKRKEVVKQVEGELERLEQRRDEYWRQVRDRREAGEESSHSDDESSSWTTGSSVDHTEETPVHVEDVAAPTVEVTEPEPEPEPATESKAERATFADAVKADTKSEEAEPKAAPEEAEVDTTPAVEQKDEKKSDKEEGYELV